MSKTKVISIQVVPTQAKDLDGTIQVAVLPEPTDDCLWSIYARGSDGLVEWKGDYPHALRDQAFAFGNALAKDCGVPVEEYAWMTEADRTASF